jgi:OmpA-OmpF porin, OOP family
MIRYFSTVLLFTFYTLLHGQLRWEGGFFIGSATSYGDLNEGQSFDFKNSNLAVGAFTRMNLDPEWGIKLKFTHGSFKGNQEVKFNTSFSDIGFLLEWDLAGNRRLGAGNSFKSIVSPFLGIGMGATYFNPQPDFSAVKGWERDEGILKDLEFARPTWRISLPITAGIKIDLSPAIAISFEASAKYPFSDYVDGLSLSFNPESNDWILVGGVGLNVRFPEKVMKTPSTLDTRPVVVSQTAQREDTFPSDIDGDGVIDEEDFCPTLAGLRIFGGCPDSDGDGIPDIHDACPDMAGPESNQGCPLSDRDRDGVPDDKDLCPDDPGSELFSGCPDFDEDGISDFDDLCPRIPGIKELKGCPELLPFEKEILNNAGNLVTFTAGSSVLRSNSMDAIDKVVGILRKYPFYGLIIQGYTDNQSRTRESLDLAERRARACYDYLLYRGVSPKRMEFKSIQGKQGSKQMEFSINLRADIK